MIADDVLSLLDLLDFDEELVNSRLKSIMDRKSFTKQHLKNAIHLLNYKHLLNIKESDECNNDSEFEFIGKLIEHVDEESVDAICKIVSVILTLSPSTIIGKSEHLLQELLLVSFEREHIDCEENHSALLSRLRLCECVVDTIIKNGKKLSLPFLEVPLENIILCQNEEIKIHFLTITVKSFFNGVTEYNILDRIWGCVKELDYDNSIALKVLCILSNYFLPLPDDEGIMLFNSNIVTQSEFWEINLIGLISNDLANRKLAVYLIKRAIDCLLVGNKDIKIFTPTVTMEWSSKDKEEYKRKWECFFILIDSLEEKQSNIVLPSLHLFSAIQDLAQCWLNCAYNIGLQHDNLQVKTTCIKYRLNKCISSDNEAIVLLESLNDMNIFDIEEECYAVKQKIMNTMSDSHSFINIIRNIPKIRWSPVPLYHLSTVLAIIKHEKVQIDIDKLFKLMYDLLKVPCNNLIIRKAFHRNLSYLIGNCCKKLQWRYILKLFNLLSLNILPNKIDLVDISDLSIKGNTYIEDINPLIILIKEQLNVPDKIVFFEELKRLYFNIDFVLLYLKGQEADLPYFIEILNEVFSNVKNTSSAFDCISDVIFLTNLSAKMDNAFLQIGPIKSLLIDQCLMFTDYISVILNSNINCNIFDDVILLLDSFKYIYDLHSCPNLCNSLYETTIALIKDGADIYKNIFCIYLLSIILQSGITKSCNLNVDVHDFIRILNNMSNVQTKEGNGRLRDLFNSKACEVVFYIILHSKKIDDFQDIINYIENALESGDRGCLKWVLCITNVCIADILKYTEIFNISHFLLRLWTEIEALKTNKEYIKCIEGFVQLITNEALLKQPIYNNEVITYCSKIIDYAMVKNMPLFYLADALGRNNVLKYGHMVYVYSEISLAVAVPRKDNRITENLIVNILKELNLKNQKDGMFTTFHIECKSFEVLSRIEDLATLEVIASLFMRKIDDLFKNKQRYHTNSTLHRTLQTAMQHLLYIFLRHRSSYAEDVFKWSLDFLGRIPHQASTRLYLEWYIALWLYYKNVDISDGITILRTKIIPITSQFMILYWLLKHKILTKSCQEAEFKLVMDTFLENTMGPTYSVRLYAQYLAARIYHLNETSVDKIDLSGYEQAIHIVNKTLTEASKLKEKSYDKLINDYFVHDFDIVKDLTPCAIYYSSHDERRNEKIDENLALRTFKDMTQILENAQMDSILNEWMQFNGKRDIKLRKFFKVTTDCKDVEQIQVDTIQKKYIPWKNISVSDIEIVDMIKKENKSELIVVASLIDKPPNLGGMARTSEVFAVNTYVIDSLRHLQDKQFQGLSVSAERWVNVLEVRPGQPLKDYLSRMKTEGYSIVGAEQTSNSTSLESFKFPKKTLLLLGNEKAGIPCDLLPYMDVCVEVPQRGVLRSLNVHVTAAIFIWEYTRQLCINNNV